MKLLINRKFRNTWAPGIQLSPAPGRIWQIFPQVVWHSEIPVLRTAPVPMFCLSKKSGENNIKVVITGEGADEMLAGYDIFKEGIIREFWSRQPDSKYRPLLFQKLYPYLAQFQGRNKNMLKLFSVTSFRISIPLSIPIFYAGRTLPAFIISFLRN